MSETTTQPTAAAMRAAWALLKESPWGAERVAALIDRETGLPGLLEACRDMLEKIERLYPNDWQGTKAKGRAALAKAEGVTP